MTREPAPYLITPVGASGPVPARAQVVHGPPLRDSLTRAELARQVAKVLVELDAANARIDALEQQVSRLRGRLEDESRLRLEAQHRLNMAMRVIAVIARLYPRLRPVIERARKDIWG